MLNEQIKLTPDHLVRVWNPNSGEGWKRADELVGGLEDEETLGDYLIIPLPKSSATPKIPKFLQLQEGHDGSTKDTHIDYLTDKDQFNTELKDEEGNRNARLGFSITPEFLELCGFYVSTASIRDDYVIFANLDSSMLDRLTTLIKAIGLEDSLSKKSQNKKTRRYYCIELYNGSLARILAKNFGVEQSQKKIPSWVHELETESKIAFLRGIFQNNGTIKREDRSKLVYYSSSHGLAIDMWLLLASIGVIASIDRKNEGKSYAVKVLNGVFILKDIYEGLVDFPALRLGEEVYLCWKIGEKSVDHWHGVYEGFMYRKRIVSDEFIDPAEVDADGVHQEKSSTE